MVGSDIYGFLGATTEELCARWTALGSFYPFARDHNNFGEPPQETYVWESVAAVGRKFVGLRYRLLPYLYTLGYEAHETGAPIARPLFFEFPAGKNACASPALDRQFLVGSALLVTPVLTQGASSVTGYVPVGTWYDVFSFARLDSKGQSMAWAVKLDDLPVLVRGGSVLPLHQPALTTTAARKLPYDLLVALSADGDASGRLYVDDGDDLQGVERSTLVEFSARRSVFGSTLTALVTRHAFAGAATFGKLTVLGVAAKPSLVLVDAVASAFAYDAATQRMDIDLGAPRSATGWR